MQKLLEKIEAAVAPFKIDASVKVENGNKATGTRARISNWRIEKMMKEFRKAPLAGSAKK